MHNKGAGRICQYFGPYQILQGEYEISGFKVLEQKLLKISRKKLYVHVLYDNLHRTNPKLGF